MIDKTYKDIVEDLEYLKLSIMQEKLAGITDKVNKRELSFLEAFGKLVELEAKKKRERSIEGVIKTAGFPHLKGLKDFDFSFQPSINKEQIYNLASLSFLELKENLVFLGTPGVGKTYLSVSLGIEVAKKHTSVYFLKANEFLSRLRLARKENRLDHSLKYYNRYKLFIIDELGLLPLKKGDEKLLFQFIDMRYEKKSTIVTTNLSFDRWDEIFEDPCIAQAILDRLLHHCHVIEIIGDSYRTKNYISNLEEND